MADFKKLEDFEPSEEEKREFTTQYAKQDENRNAIQSEIQTGRIVKITDSEVMIDIGTKHEIKISIDEIKDENGNIKFNEGDNIDLLKQRNNFSHKKAIRQIETKKAISVLNKDELIGTIINAKILESNRNGFVLKWIDKNIEVFLPTRESALKPDSYDKDKPIKVCIKKITENSIIVSRKQYFDEKKKVKNEKMQAMLQAMESGTILSGEVVNIKHFGIFVDLGGIEGLVHSSELSHKNFAKPAELYKKGDKVDVKILGYDEAKDKLSLSIKALAKDPWESIAQQLEVGYTIKAIVSSIQPYGAFIDAGNDIEGFLHITEVSWEKNIKQISDYVKVGDEINVEIIELDPSRKRLRVSLKKLTEKPFVQFSKQYKVGDILKGSVATLTDFGAFIRFNNVDGLLHNEDLSWEKGSKCKDALKIGDEVEVKILKIDKENEEISLSKKAILESPVSKFAKAHKVNDVVKGNIVEIKDFGVFVRLEDNIDALIRKDDLSPLKENELNIGDEIESCIAHIDLQNNKIRLSVRKLAHKKERAELNNYNNNEKMTLGEVLKDKFNNNK